MKRKAEEYPDRPPSLILRTELAGRSEGVISRLPERENLRKAMRRARRRNLPPNPTTLQELGEIPERFENTVTGDRFLIYDSRNEDDDVEGNILVFATRRNLEILSQREVWYVDGTFEVQIDET